MQGIGVAMRTTTCRVTAMRDCLISAFTACVHLVLIGSPAEITLHQAKH